jgi:hypothetical protein
MFSIVCSKTNRYESLNNPMMKTFRCLAALLVLEQILWFSPASAADWVVYPAGHGPGKGKHIVFLSGDEEYRSEEALPMLAKILAVRHGFKCTVLFPINPSDGVIDPVTQTNIPGMEALDSADLCVMGLRFRELPDSQMKHFVDYLKAGKPSLPYVPARTLSPMGRINKALTRYTIGKIKTGLEDSDSRCWVKPG